MEAAAISPSPPNHLPRALRDCPFCEPACYDHAIEWLSQGQSVLAPRYARVSQQPGRGMTYESNPTPPLVGADLDASTCPKARHMRLASPDESIFGSLWWFPTLGVSECSRAFKQAVGHHWTPLLFLLLWMREPLGLNAVGLLVLVLGFLVWFVRRQSCKLWNPRRSKTD